MLKSYILTTSSAVLAGFMSCLGACAGETTAVDVVHFWVSDSEAAAIQVFRDAWVGAGNEWYDMPAANKVAVQEIVSDRIAEGYSPAVMQWNANEGSRELPEMGIVLDIEQVAASDDWRAVLPPSTVNRITFEDKVFFAPTGIHAENWLWTSQRVFDEVGLEAPSSWEEVISAAEAIAAAGFIPIAIGDGAWEISIIFNNLVYYNLGPDGYASVISADPQAVGSPEMTKALEMLRSLSKYVQPIEERTGKSWAEATDMVGRGEAGMQFMGDWAKGELIFNNFEVDKDFGCVLAPGTSIAYFMVVDAFAFPLTGRVDQVNAQREFARMVMDPENQVAFSRVKGSLPARTDIDPVGLDRCGRLGAEMLAENSGVSAQSMAMPAQMSEGWIAVLSDFFNDDKMTAAAAQEKLQDIVSYK